jgi:Rps23 Pro-64 3,4-dihydroxylase Tpa1-like proline 4-hydroxylase
MSKLKIFDNVLSESLLKSITEYSRSSEVNHSYQLWETGVVQDSNVVLIKHFNEEMRSKILSEVGKYLPDQYEQITFSWFGWTRGSYIPWHADAHTRLAGTIYLNEHWDDNWGGWFAYEDGGEIKCIKPQHNRMAMILPPTRHTVFTISPIAPIRETIQIFAK